MTLDFVSFCGSLVALLNNETYIDGHQKPRHLFNRWNLWECWMEGTSWTGLKGHLSEQLSDSPLSGERSPEKASEYLWQ